VALNWRLWLGLGTMSTVGDPGPADNDLMAWFMRYAADAVAHGHLPALVTTALNALYGFPLMWNNSVLFPQWHWRRSRCSPARSPASRSW